MERFRIDVGHIHKVMPGNIVGAIANEAGLDARHIGRINIFENYSTVDLPEDMPAEIFRDLKKVWVAGQTLKISREAGEQSSSKPSRPPIGKTDGTKQHPEKKQRKPKADRKKTKTREKAKSK
jgi:ATP-dependent RNA helicase DeaD